MAIREGRWDCSACGTDSVLGRYKFCPNCGAQRPTNVRFYLPEREPEVTDSELLRLAKAGPDWSCQHCGQDNSGSSTFCGFCGAPKDGSSDRKVKTYSPNEVPHSSGEAREEEPESYRPKVLQETYREILEEEAQTKKKEFNFSRFVLPGAMAAVAIFLGFLFFNTRSVPITVVGHSWERTVTVEEYKTVVEEDWLIPVGGRFVSQHQDIHHYDTVVSGSHEESYQDCHQEYTGSRTYTCGSRDLGNGFFEDVECTESIYETVCETRYRTVTDYEEVPVYQTKYVYEIERWVWNREEVSQGQDMKPFWPVFSLASNEREGKKNEEYIVLFADDEGKQYTHAIDIDAWVSFNLGDIYLAKINRLGQIREIEIER